MNAHRSVSMRDTKNHGADAYFERGSEHAAFSSSNRRRATEAFISIKTA
jgi:hypothetical protein